jgi:hypothetical protein
MTARDRLTETLVLAAACGCREQREYVSAQAVRDRHNATEDALKAATGRLEELLQQKKDVDTLIGWFDEQKDSVRNSGLSGPEVDGAFARYEEVLRVHASNWSQVVTRLSHLRERLIKSLEQHTETSRALAKLEKKLVELESCYPAEAFYLRHGRLGRIASRHQHGYPPEPGDLELLEKEIDDLTARLLQQEADRKSMHAGVNEYLEGQVERFAEKMTVAEYKKLEPLKADMENPTSRLALWSLLHNQEKKHSTQLKLSRVKKPPKTKVLDASSVKTGWEVLTLVAESDKIEPRERVLEQLNAALSAKGKKRETALAETRKQAECLDENE